MPMRRVVLEDFYRRHLFIERRVGENVIYTYHALFRQFLRTRATLLLGAAESARNLSAAGHLLEAEGDVENAFALFREACDWSAAARLVLANAERLRSQGRTQVITAWISALPREVTAASPWLQFRAGIALLEVDQPRAALWLEPAYEGFVAAERYAGAVVVRRRHRRKPLQRDGGLRHAGSVGADPGARLDRLAAVRHARGRDPGRGGRGDRARRCAVPRVQRCAPSRRACGKLLEDDLEVTDRIAAGGLLLTHYMVAGDRANAASLVDLLDPLTRDPRLAPRRRILWMISHAAWFNADARFAEATAELAEAESLSEQTASTAR